MSCDSKILIKCEKHEFLDIADKVVDILNVWLRDKLDKHISENTTAINRINFFWSDEFYSDYWTNGVNVSSSNFRTFNMTFGCGDEFHGAAKRRSIFVCWNDHDYNDTISGGKMILSLSKWGSYEAIVDSITKGLKGEREVYYTYNDCEDDSFVKV